MGRAVRLQSRDRAAERTAPERPHRDHYASRLAARGLAESGDDLAGTGPGRPSARAQDIAEEATVHNVFHVNVGSGDRLAGDDLAERLAAVLRDQARRHGVPLV